MRHRVDRVEARDVKLQLVKLGATPSQLKRPEVAELSKILYENEIIEAFILGYYDGGYGMMVATNIRVVFIDITPFGRLKIDDIPYGSVNSVELQIGMFFASVSLFSGPVRYRFWWLNKNSAHDFNRYVEYQMLKHQKEDVKL
ncbi:PH domain-containing protein [Candidatus Saccharibacteria bacterium]|nr:PH domain-containing protein [Candidatus Saccharibacteria bacterium]